MEAIEGAGFTADIIGKASSSHVTLEPDTATFTSWPDEVMKILVNYPGVIDAELKCEGTKAEVLYLGGQDDWHVLIKCAAVCIPPP